MRKNQKYFIAILFLCICGNVFPQSSLSHLSLENRYNTMSIEYQFSNNRLADFNIVSNYKGKTYISRESYKMDKIFSNYYIPDYNGIKTNDEVTAIMSEYEKSILNLVIETENQK